MISEKPTFHPQPKLSASQRREKETQQRLDNAEMHVGRLIDTNSHLLKILWLAMQQTGGKLTVDLSGVPVLWEIKKLPQGENKNEITFEAGVMPEIPEEKIKECGEFLIRTQARLEEAAKEFNFEGYQLPYLELRLRPYACFNGQGWTDKVA